MKEVLGYENINVNARNGGRVHGLHLAARKMVN